jgi:hypothetical protein
MFALLVWWSFVTRGSGNAAAESREALVEIEPRKPPIPGMVSVTRKSAHSDTATLQPFAKVDIRFLELKAGACRVLDWRSGRD